MKVLILLNLMKITGNLRRDKHRHPAEFYLENKVFLQ